MIFDCEIKVAKLLFNLRKFTHPHPFISHDTWDKIFKFRRLHSAEMEIQYSGWMRTLTNQKPALPPRDALWKQTIVWLMYVRAEWEGEPGRTPPKKKPTQPKLDILSHKAYCSDVMQPILFLGQILKKKMNKYPVSSKLCPKDTRKNYSKTFTHPLYPTLMRTVFSSSSWSCVGILGTLYQRKK